MSSSIAAADAALGNLHFRSIYRENDFIDHKRISFMRYWIA